MGAAARDRQLYVPQPPDPNDRRGASAYAALSNHATNSNAGGGAPAPAVDLNLALAAALTSRTGGRFRVAGSISGTATAADQVTVTLEVDINGGGWTAIATSVHQVSAAPGARFGVMLTALTAAVPIGQTVNARIRAVDATGNAMTVNVAAGQVTINAQELPG